ncbi:Pol polyprotein [Plakobranchus ocellatus]|uniref:Pol polyprotein n=1 Tax=Plakobranchus ocellatus TaxID=259542 RepID=A0AAV4A925_9GAST|nr:Pol polyprotein [Plakobranchus ocellatus]
MLIRLHKFDITLNYKEGKNMFISDMLSRTYLKEKNVVDEQIEKDIHLYVNQIRDSWNVKDYKLKQIEAETSTDIDLQDLKKQILEGFPAKRNNLRRNLHEFFTNSEELSIQGDLIVKGTKIIIPQTMRNEMLQILHSSHAGIEKSKQRARESIYWPRINKDIEDYVNRCSTCQTHRNSKQKEPLLPVEVPQLPWNTVGLDVFTLKSHDYLLCVDYYSKYPEVTKLFTKTAHGIITALKPFFARHGIPNQVIADNMPFNSQEFLKFAKEWDFHVTTTSPLYPQANGQVERFVGIIKTAMKKSQDPNIAILQCRNTPITGLKYSPAQLLFNRRLRDNIPTLKINLKPAIPVKARQELQSRQQKQKVFF